MRFILLCLMMMATQAHALSCIPADPAASFNRYAEAEDSYVVLYGRFSFDERELPKPPAHDLNDTDPNTYIPTKFSGKSLSMAGFVNDFSGDVTLNATCLGPWCAGMQSDIPQMAFVQKSGQMYTLTISPCGGAAFPNPSPAARDTVAACLRGETCERSDGFLK